MAAGFKGKKLTKFDPTNHISARHTDSVHPIWTKSGTDILIDFTNKFVDEFYIFSKSKMAAWVQRSKINQI